MNEGKGNREVRIEGLPFRIILGPSGAIGRALAEAKRLHEAIERKSLTDTGNDDIMDGN